MATPPRVGIALAFLAFLSLGLPDGCLGVAWPQMRSALGVKLEGLGLLLGMAMGGTLLSSGASGFLIARVGVGRLLVGSTALVALSAAGFAASPSWTWALASSLVGGFGAGAVDAGVNAHAASAFTPRAVSFLHATFGFGAMAGPILMTAFIERPLGWRIGYAVLAAVLGALAVAFAFNLSVWSAPRVARESPGPDARPSSVGHRLTIVFGIVLFFVYSGVEASCGQWAFTFLTEGLGFGPRWAGLAVSGYYGALGLGRVVFGLAAHRTAAPRLIRIGALAALASGLVLSVARGPLAVAALLVMGVALAPIYPLAIAETPRRVGAAWADRAVGWQVSAAYIGFVWPSLGGIVASRLEVAALGPFFAALAVLLMVVTEAVLRGPHADAAAVRP